MFVAIDEDILGLDVAVGDGEHEEVVESPEDLVGVELDEDGVDFPLLDDLVEVVGVVVHDDVEVLVVALVGREAVLHHQVVRVLQHLQDLVLPVLVLLILEHLFYCDLLTRTPVHPEVHHPERALPRHSLHLVLRSRDFGLGVDGVGDIDFGAFIGLCLEVLVEGHGLILVDFEVFALGVGVLGNIFGVDIDELGLGADFISFFEIVAIVALLGLLLHLGDDPPVHLFAGVALDFLGVLLIENHLSLTYQL